jgi:hypothetical protein
VAGGGARWYRFRAELRARRLGWIGVAIIIGLSAGLVLALVAGGRRSDTAIDRFLAGADAHEQLVISGIPGTFDFAEVDLDEVAALPGVADSQRAVVLAGSGRTDAGRLIDASTVNYLADPSGRVGRDFDRFKVLDGRLADPGAADEVVATFRLAEDFDLEAGSTIDVNLLDEGELEAIFTGQATFEDLSEVGPLQRLEVVGVVVEAGGLAPPAPDDTTTLWMTPAAADQFGDAVIIQTELIQLEGAGSEAAFLDDLDGLGGGRPVLSASTATDAAEADRSVTPVVRALHLTAVLIALVTVFVAGQVLARQAAAESGNDAALRSVGWTHRDLLRERVAKALVIGLGAAVVAVLVAILLSPVFPLGLARIVEPDPGVDVDGLVVAAGALGVIVLTVGLATLVGWLELRRGNRRAVGRPNRLVGAVSSAGVPPPVAVGTSLALQGGRAGAVAPIVSAGLTVALGIGTVAAVLTFMASLGHLTETPRLYGWNWDVELGQEFSEALTDEDVAVLREDPEVAAVAVGTSATLNIGDQRIDAYAVSDERGRIEPSLLSGRRADGVDEIVVAPDVGDVGDDITVRFADAEAVLTIVGHAALPRADAMLTFEALRTVATDARQQTALVSLREDADVDAFLDRVSTSLNFTGQDVATPDLPDDLVNFGRVDSAPVVVAIAMGIVAMATLVHALVTTVRRRRRDLAVLRSLGLTGRQVLGTVAWQAAILIAFAVLVAVPVGVAAGRWGWILFAGELKVISEPIVPALALLGAALVSILLAEVVALLAGRWSIHRSAAAVLRTE